MAYSRGQTLEDFLDLITYEDPTGKKRCAAEASLIGSQEDLYSCKTLASHCNACFSLCQYNKLFIGPENRTETHKVSALSIPGVCALSPGITQCLWPRRLQGIDATVKTRCQQLGSGEFRLLFGTKTVFCVPRNLPQNQLYSPRQLHVGWVIRSTLLWHWTS